MPFHHEHWWHLLPQKELPQIYLSLGAIGSLLSIVVIVLSLLMGKLSDHKNKRIILRHGAVFDAASWIARAFVATPVHVFLATFFGAIMTGIKVPSVEALEYDKAKGENPAAYFVSREVFISLGRIFLLILVMMSANLEQGFIFQGAASFAVLLF